MLVSSARLCAVCVVTLCVCVGQVGDVGQFHAARCPGAVPSGEFQRHEVFKHHIEIFSLLTSKCKLKLWRFSLPASGQRREQDEGDMCGRHHPEALQRKDGGKLAHFCPFFCVFCISLKKKKKNNLFIYFC